MTNPPPPPHPSRRLSLGIAALLAAGIVLAGGGTAAAISGFAADTTAVNAQYGPPQPGGPIEGAGGAAPAPANTSTAPSLGSEGERDSTTPTTPTTPATADAPNQVVAAAGSGDTLPFTGFAAIPIVIAGAVLIAAGALLRRRTRQIPR